MIKTAIIAALTAFIFCLITGKWFIRWLQQKHLGQQVRQEGPKSHYTKAGTPTMGGALILGATFFSALLWGNWHNPYFWIGLSVLLGFGVIGWLDDYRKISRKNSKGLPARWKYCWQSLLAVMVGLYLYGIADNKAEASLFIPLLKESIPLGLAYIFMGYFVIVGSSNAVNLTDGMDGLATVPSALVALGLSILAFVAGSPHYSALLGVPYVPGAEGLMVLGLSLLGACLGFLWFNAAPAMVFMGDVGSLAIGGLLGTMAFILHQELLFFIMSLLFVVETLSVMLQVGCFKLTKGKRLFRMAPIHHHFELMGIPETRLVIRLWILSAWCVLMALFILFC